MEHRGVVGPVEQEHVTVTIHLRELGRVELGALALPEGGHALVEGRVHHAVAEARLEPVFAKDPGVRQGLPHRLLLRTLLLLLALGVSGDGHTAAENEHAPGLVLGRAHRRGGVRAPRAGQAGTSLLRLGHVRAVGTLEGAVGCRHACNGLLATLAPAPCTKEILHNGLIGRLRVLRLAEGHFHPLPRVKLEPPRIGLCHPLVAAAREVVGVAPRHGHEGVVRARARLCV
mmetsp:Transcript_2845/g.8199  ORF Transcript_2845/g.8199 Transcript_2845/m.8199 type:complete len:230 (-) Transcript_2845:468-1157(-)